MDMNIKVEISEKIDHGDGFITYLVECNGYEGEERKIQFSRSPFVFQGMTDEEVIELVTNNYYYIYL
jgi:hypothetical protein